MAKEFSNRLANESSPYLRQHAHNPVNWYPWGAEALNLAKEENKLLLISIGYSSCHWCHVMEKETFENKMAADYMNRHFVNIKVDREERPDLDQIYMSAVQIMTGRGGWPLNCFALPDGRPVYGGTYFPNDQWMHILRALVEMQQQEPAKMEEYASRLTEGVGRGELLPRSEEKRPIQPEVIRELVEAWKSSVDMVRGGPNRAPKFPLPNSLEFMFRYQKRHGDTVLRDFVLLTLRKMALGGIFDQAGGGFARYSTDVYWKVPHFEKMLYDNAQLLSVYAMAWAETGDLLFKDTIEMTIGYLNREMLHSQGAWFSALDADSEGEEGRFYVWTLSELQAALGDQYGLAEKHFHFDEMGHWEHGNYVLMRQDNASLLFSQDPLYNDGEISLLRERLLAVRGNRQRPGLDDKILCSWNALTIKGLCDASRYLRRKDFLEMALRCGNFIRRNLLREDGGLWHTWKEGKPSVNGYLEDYCFTAESFISLYELTFDESWLHEAKQLADYTLDHFFDPVRGMFWFTSALDPPLIARKQEVMDNVLPASNSSMAKVLFLLGRIFDNPKYSDVSAQMLSNVLPAMDYGQNFSNWAILHEWFEGPFVDVAITGSDAASLGEHMVAEFHPCSLIAGSMGDSELPLLRERTEASGGIFVCVDKTCLLPTNEPEIALKYIEEHAR
jgi:uncharacterized protein YyaL (SSP411 family)